MSSNHQKLRDDAYRAFKRNSLDPEVQLALDREYQQADQHARLVLTDDGYQEFASTFVSSAKTKLDAYRAGDPTSHPYDGTREQPLCTCSDRFCTIKDGRLPRRVRAADDPVEATRQFMHTHSGDPLVLQDLKREYDELCAEFDHRHRRIIICGTHNIHPDDLDGLEPATDDADAESETAADAAVADD
ncbi:hypothetical protein [Natrinema ejinorense]|uniref:Uncharacterized protein n=1 Tax=Natrinema ejinorense TaxID=373386 RepID=A0A2A5QPC1_9EURY|nr:hypothetical protein [Natrinema ejinorense]PCR88696.1 hypothetical protein CP557_21955 [Natrinema ejinorense]